MNRDDLFKLTEKRLFRYSDNLEKLAELKTELEALRSKGDIKAQQYSVIGYNSGAGDPVAEYVNKLLKLETKLKKLKSEVSSVSKFISDMEEEKSPASRNVLLFIRLFYIDKHSVKEIADGLKIPRRTLYARRRQIVKKCSKYFEELSNMP